VDSLVPGGSHLLSKFSELFEHETADESNKVVASRIGEIEMGALQTQQRLQQEIRKLTISIESGWPLLGRCEACPKVYFLEKARRINLEKG